MRFLSFLLVLFLSVLTCGAKTVNPLQYGLLDAKNGTERFEALIHCHEDAIRQKARISYAGIEEIELEIPFKAKCIPLPDYTDFAGVKIIVNNTDRDCVLFRMANETKDIQVSGKEIDDGNFYNRKELKKGTVLLILEDQNPWVKERLGYQGGGVNRKDIVILKNGVSQNRTVMPYDNANTMPKAKFCAVRTRRKLVKNLIFERTHSSTRKTYPIAIEYQYNVELSNIITTTPQNSDLVSDCGIMIYNCAKIKINDVTINGTYSKENKSGSGMRLINVYDVQINRMYARSKWGVFGNHSVNKVMLKDCDINRFDIHCYGRDVTAIGCTFSDMYNQYSAFYGKLIYRKCKFINFIPVLIESSYNAYTPFDCEMDGCSFKFTKDKNFILTLFRVPEPINPRLELKEKCIPNFTIRYCSVLLDNDVKEWYLIKTHGLKYRGEMDYLSKIDIRGLSVSGGENSILKIFSENVPLKRELKIISKNINTKFEQY